MRLAEIFEFPTGDIAIIKEKLDRAKHVTLPKVVQTQRSKKDYRLVIVDLKMLDKLWKKSELYIPFLGGSSNQSKVRIEMILDLLLLPDIERKKRLSGDFESAELSVSDTGEINFLNGRHRVATWRDLGEKIMKIAISTSSITNANKFGLLVK